MSYHFFLLDCSKTSLMCGQNLVVRNKTSHELPSDVLFFIDKIYNDGKSGGWLLMYTHTKTFHISVLFLSRMRNQNQRFKSILFQNLLFLNSSSWSFAKAVYSMWSIELIFKAGKVLHTYELARKDNDLKFYWLREHAKPLNDCVWQSTLFVVCIHYRVICLWAIATKTWIGNRVKSIKKKLSKQKKQQRHCFSFSLYILVHLLVLCDIPLHTEIKQTKKSLCANTCRAVI